MRRVARRLLTLCSALSLVLCVAVCVLWVRGRTRAEQLSAASAGSLWVLESNDRHLGLVRVGGWRDNFSVPWYGVAPADREWELTPLIL